MDWLNETKARNIVKCDEKNISLQVVGNRRIIHFKTGFNLIVSIFNFILQIILLTLLRTKLKIIYLHLQLKITI